MNEALDILTTASLWAAVLRIATPLIFGSLGALICERSGVLNLGIEGIMTMGAGRVGIRHAAQYADHWCPLDAQLLNDGDKPDVAGGIDLFRRLVSEHGRDPETIPISIFAFGGPNRRRLDQYQALGVDRIVALPPSLSRHDETITMHWLDQWRTIMDDMQ